MPHDVGSDYGFLAEGDIVEIFEQDGARRAKVVLAAGSIVEEPRMVGRTLARPRQGGGPSTVIFVMRWMKAVREVPRPSSRSLT